MKTNIVEKVAAIGLLALAVLVCASAASRYLFNWPIPDTLDLSRILLGLTVFWGIALAICKDEQIQVDLLWEHLGSEKRTLLLLLNRVIMIGFAALFGYLLIEHIWHVSHTGKQTVDYRLPLWWFYLLFVPAGIIPVYASVKALLSKTDSQSEQDED